VTVGDGVDAYAVLVGVLMAVLTTRSAGGIALLD
jgi:hypothetical protein